MAAESIKSLSAAELEALLVSHNSGNLVTHQPSQLVSFNILKQHICDNGGAIDSYGRLSHWPKDPTSKHVWECNLRYIATLIDPNQKDLSLEYITMIVEYAIERANWSDPAFGSDAKSILKQLIEFGYLEANNDSSDAFSRTNKNLLGKFSNTIAPIPPMLGRYFQNHSDNTQL
ncbi:hypothetical protein BCR33DRAFT_721702 [Rhizoclosmatium globosum]|uniref:Uncharacterized protein n=1 Tax=Rhizoclosmatium globosum TaxID=329046 RepID=A0A1Y2BSG5_9FUNG|nr:hypothetical protein BCR33DRAFT_721702 [Rhizoclosmatium globosum]|eukprot:ORY37065.1 hypothetical protein BCR33DRAFT_721702 [Rhizoclosmatium globosum]